MSNQEQEFVSETSTTCENSENQPLEENQSVNDANNENEKSSSSPTSETKISDEQERPRRLNMPQDIRYSTEQGDREKILEKYDNYQVSETNSCNIRFVIDHQQKKNLLGRSEEENSNLHSIGKTFHLNILPAYQNPTKHSYKIFGTETNVRKCLIEIMNRIFKHSNRSPVPSDTENSNQQATTPNPEKSQDTDVSAENDKPLPQPTSIFVTTINPDSSITEEKKVITPSTPHINDEKSDSKDENNEQERFKFVPLERKPEYTLTILITGQGQEVLKKNWNFFGGPLQQRLNVTVMNPFKLPKFGDNQWQNELSITGELYENLVDAALRLTVFINDVLGVSVQPYKFDEEFANSDHNNYQRTKNTNNNDYHQQRRYEYNSNSNNNYRQSPSQQQHQGQTPPFNNYHERTFFNRGGRNGSGGGTGGSGAYEQVILLRSNCVARIVGTRGSNLRRIQSRCHLRDIVVARHANDNGYVDCTLSAYQTRNLNFAIDTIRSCLRNEDDQAIQVLEAHYVDIPSQSSPYQHSPQNDQPQLSVSNQHSHQSTFRQQPMSLIAPSDSHREPGFMTRPLHLGNGTHHLPQPSYNFQNTPSFDFTHRPTSASRKTDKRPGEVADFTPHTNHGQIRTSNDCQSQQYGGSSSSNSSSVSPRHKSKRTCPETKEIDCTTDDGFWIQKQFYHALDDASKDLFDTLLDKLEKIRIANEENAARKQQRLVGRNRSNKARVFNTSTTHTNGEKDLSMKSNQDDTHENKIDKSTNGDEQKENQDVVSNEEITTTNSVEQK